LQLRNPKEVSTEEYNEFYKKTFNEYLDPLASSHFTTEVHVFGFIFSMVIIAMAGLDLTV
jgi:heat shock protein beta